MFFMTKIKLEDRRSAEMGINGVDAHYVSSYINCSSITCMYPDVDQSTGEKGTLIEFSGGGSILAYERMSMIMAKINLSQAENLNKHDTRRIQDKLEGPD